MRTRLTALVATGALLAGAGPVGAATFNVDKLADDAGGGACTAAPNDCSLRSAVAKANAAGDADTIALGSGTHTLTFSLTNLVSPMTFAGAGARATTIDAAGVANGLIADSGSNPAVAVRDLTLRGVKTGSSAAIANAGGDLDVIRAAVVDNASGGISSNGETVIADSLVARNSGVATAGVIGTDLLIIRNSTITQNTALVPSPDTPLVYGAGVIAACLTTVQNSTVAGNIVDPSASTLSGVNLGTLPFASCPQASIRVSNSVVAGGGPGGDCGGEVLSAGGNVDSDGTCRFTLASDRSAATADLAPLADNGGPTDTRALGAASAALGLGVSCLPADQRGIARPLGGACDAGAFESALAPPAPPAPTAGRRRRPPCRRRRPSRRPSPCPRHRTRGPRRCPSEAWRRSSAAPRCARA